MKPDIQAIAPPRNWILFGKVGLGCSVVLAALYILVQWAQLGTIGDAGLIACVILNTAAVLVFGFHITPHIAEMLDAIPDAAQPLQARVDAILNHPWAIPFALLYAASIGIGSWVVDPHGENGTFRALLSLYLFAGNLMIGFGFFAILRFWAVFLTTLPSLQFRILNLNRPPLPAILRVNSKIVMITAFVASMSVVGVVLSNFELAGLTVLHSGFTLALVVATYAVPVLPLSNVLRRRKSEELDVIERMIVAHVEGMPHGKTDPDLPELSRLKEAKAMITAVQTLPPGGQVSVSAAAIVTFLSFLPTLIEYAKKFLSS